MLQYLVNIKLPPQVKKNVQIERPATTQMKYFCSKLDSWNQDLTKNHIWNIADYNSHIALEILTESAPGPITLKSPNIRVSVVCRAIQLPMEQHS